MTAMLLNNSIAIATWNIAGGRQVKSLEKLFDYQKEDLGYFAKQIKLLA